MTLSMNVGKRRGGRSSAHRRDERRRRDDGIDGASRRLVAPTPLHHHTASTAAANPSIEFLFQGTRFFLIKRGNLENVELEKAKNVWATTSRNEALLNEMFRKTRNVILVFSVERSQGFQGFARVLAESDRQLAPVRWHLPPGMDARRLGGLFRLQWVSRRELPFANTAHLTNPYNQHKPVKIGRDGQEIEPATGRVVCALFPLDREIDLESLVRKVKRQQAEHPFTYTQRTDKRFEPLPRSATDDRERRAGFNGRRRSRSPTGHRRGVPLKRVRTSPGGSGFTTLSKQRRLHAAQRQLNADAVNNGLYAAADVRMPPPAIYHHQQHLPMGVVPYDAGSHGYQQHAPALNLAYAPYPQPMDAMMGAGGWYGGGAPLQPLMSLGGPQWAEEMPPPPVEYQPRHHQHHARTRYASPPPPSRHHNTESRGTRRRHHDADDGRPAPRYATKANAEPVRGTAGGYQIQKGAPFRPSGHNGGGDMRHPAGGRRSDSPPTFAARPSHRDAAPPQLWPPQPSSSSSSSTRKQAASPPAAYRRMLAYDNRRDRYGAASGSAGATQPRAQPASTVVARSSVVAPVSRRSPREGAAGGDRAQAGQQRSRDDRFARGERRR